MKEIGIVAFFSAKDRVRVPRHPSQRDRCGDHTKRDRCDGRRAELLFGRTSEEPHTASATADESRVRRNADRAAADAVAPMVISNK